jgi:hypothetical protein
MNGLRAWWVARQAARHELNAYLAGVDAVIGSRLDDAEWDTDTDQSWVYGLDLLDEM